jgi:predicted regulator of Ras-like GTPase activity (Roadblock/LC7/MglB family)
MEAIQLQPLLTSYVKKNKSAQIAAIASVDGFTIAHAAAPNTSPELDERVSAMISSMAALADAFGREFQQSSFENVVLKFPGLQAVVCAITVLQETFILGIAVNGNAKTIATHAKNIIAKIEEALSETAKA